MAADRENGLDVLEIRRFALVFGTDSRSTMIVRWRTDVGVPPFPMFQKPVLQKQRTRL